MYTELKELIEASKIYAGTFTHEADYEAMKDNMFDKIRKAEKALLKQDVKESEIVKALRAYIEFLGKDISKNAGFLYAHRIQASEETVKEGERLRKVIADLSDTAKIYKKPLEYKEWLKENWPKDVGGYKSDATWKSDYEKYLAKFK